MVRLAFLLRRMQMDPGGKNKEGMTHAQLFYLIRYRVQQLLEDQAQVWKKTLRPLLRKEGIHFIDVKTYTEPIHEFAKNYYQQNIHPILTPVAFDPGHPFPHISNLTLNLAVVVEQDGQTKFARVKIPKILPRFIELPQGLSSESDLNFIFLEDVIQLSLHELFRGTIIKASYLFRVVRDTLLEIQEEEAKDLLETIHERLKELPYGPVTMLRVQSSMPQYIIDILITNFEVGEGIVLKTNDRMGVSDWSELRNIPRSDLKYKKFHAPTIFDGLSHESFFQTLRTKDILIHHPYESFGSIEAFLKIASEDTKVIGIKMTLYRIAPNSPILDHLINAAHAGKQVSVLVELKARFDESNNVNWARYLEGHGVYVVYGLLKLKTHCKVCLVIRKEEKGIESYVHLGTGNYNGITAKIYTDLGLFTSNSEIAADVTEIFHQLTGYSQHTHYQHLLVAPNTLRKRVKELISREIEYVHSGKKGHIIIKVNALEDQDIIKALYAASQAGVVIQLIVRGICGLRPGISGMSERISVISILGRFLEHSRIYYFGNGGKSEIYIGSADLMERNLNQRVEILCPILDMNIKTLIEETILPNTLNDNQWSSVLQTDGTYVASTIGKNGQKLQSQEYFLQLYGDKGNLLS